MRETDVWIIGLVASGDEFAYAERPFLTGDATRIIGHEVVGQLVETGLWRLAVRR